MHLDEALITVRAVADRSRLMILNALAAGPMCAEEIAATLDLAPSTVSFHLKKLAGAGLVTAAKDQYYSVYRLKPDLLGTTLGQLLGLQDPAENLPAERAERDRRRVLDAFFSGGVLLKMPAQKRKRGTVLEQFAHLFAAGRTYPEREADQMIAPVFADYCLVRRLLIDEGYLQRSHGEYLRTAKTCSGAPLGLATHESTKETVVMDGDKKRLREAYKTEAKVAGIFRVTNKATNKVFLGSTLNMRGPLNRVEFELQLGSSWIPGLQEDYNRYGKDNFSFEVVELVEPNDDPEFNVERQLEKLEREYEAALDRNNTYNVDEHIRFIKVRTRL
jgi:hypothetical protein